MRHRHVTATLEAETVDRIEARLESGETVSAWVAEAARRRLDPGDGSDDSETGDVGTGDDRTEGPRYEFVDDCAI